MAIKEGSYTAATNSHTSGYGIDTRTTAPNVRPEALIVALYSVHVLYNWFFVSRHNLSPTGGTQVALDPNKYLLVCRVARPPSFTSRMASCLSAGARPVSHHGLAIDSGNLLSLRESIPKLVCNHGTPCRDECLSASPNSNPDSTLATHWKYSPHMVLSPLFRKRHL